MSEKRPVDDSHSVEETQLETHSIADAMLERDLRDAYVVPPIPPSLRQRYAETVHQEFGIRLPSTASESSGSRLRRLTWIQSLRGWPIAAAIVLVVVTFAVFRDSGTAYGWHTMLEAIRQYHPHSVIEVVRTDQSGESKKQWALISRGLVGESNGSSHRTWDYRRGVVTQYRDGVVQRAQFAKGNPKLASQQALVAVLLNRIGDAEFTDSIEVMDRGWSTAESESGKAIDLHVTVKTTDDEQELSIRLRREDQLPISILPISIASPLAEDDSSRETSRIGVSVSDETSVENWIPASLPIREVEISSLDLAPGLPEPEDSLASKSMTEADTTKTDGDRSAKTLPTVGVASMGWGAVQPTGMAAGEFTESLDALMERLWLENQVSPTQPASQFELVRRVHLDLVGRTPTVAEVRAYENDLAENRFERLVDRLLASRDHATHIAASWRSFLLPEGVDLTRFGGTEAFERWMAERVLAGRGYDEIVRELLLAEGRLTRSGPLLFYAAAKLDADKLAARSARVFLGMRLECAQCHDDPFEPYTQEDFWGFAAFFAQISRPNAELETVSSVMRVHDIERGEVLLPDSEEIVAPRFLDLSEVDVAPGATARRKQLAAWMTSPQNPFFARATANRVWAHLFGRGIVNPVDGFGEMNPPQSEELLELVAGQLIESGFDLRSLFRGLVMSRAYQLSSGADTPDPSRRQWFAQMNVKTFTAEQVYDCITVASMLDTPANNEQFRITRVGNASRDQFVAQFKTPIGQPTQYHGGIAQSLTLMNGALIDSATGLATSGLLKSLDAPFLNDDQRVEILYLATLSRNPTVDERARVNDFLKSSTSSKTESLADILWVLLNSAEFTLNH